MGTSAGNYGREMYKNPEWIRKCTVHKILKRIEVKKECPKCGHHFNVIRKINKDGTERTNDERTYCSRKCANSRIFSKETREKISLKNNKQVIKTCLNCNVLFKADIKRKFCCRKCVSEYRHKQLEEYKKYRADCYFRFSLNRYKNYFDFSLIKKYGWYKAKNHGNNLNGISRDHLIPIRYAYEHNISPEIISHPANCQLLRHNDNVSKGKKPSISLEELTEKIKNSGL